MNSEDELRNRLASTPVPTHTIDAARVIAHSRRRRLPGLVAAGAVSTLAIAGIVIVAVQTIQFSSPASMTSQGTAETGASDTSEAAPTEGFSSAVKRAPAEKINLCTGTLADVSPSGYGLRLDVNFPAMAAAGTASVSGTVTLTNTSDTRVTGYTAPTPALTFSQNGIVLWHSNGPMIMSLAIVDLAPGASLTYPASFIPVRCEVDDDLGASFRDDLPAVPAGQYDLSAVIDFTADPSMVTAERSELDLVTGPLSPITVN